MLLSAITYAYKDTLLLNRYAQVFQWYENKDLLLKRNYSINNRLKIYLVGTSTFTDFDKYGINGSGLAPQVIKETYDARFKDKFEFKTKTYNAHNQFINNFIDWGLAGVLLTFLLLYLILKHSYASKLTWISFFWLCFAVILLMESVLIRHRGIVFFVIFYALFYNQKKAITAS